ncbi:MAG TPA: calcium-binding protein [Nitrososphaeraceae archaeon]|nr:calcium-binding protein [Nitrososphaeraceae archaeon]
MNFKILTIPAPRKFAVIFLTLLVITTFSLHSSFADDNSNNNSNGLNVISGTRSYTRGTSGDDMIIACPPTTIATTGGCTPPGDTLRGLGGNDILQGSIGDDNLYGDTGADTLNGADGNDNLYGGPGDDVIQGGVGNDMLVGGPGNDELYGGPGDDVMIGGPGADYFDCGDGQDIVVDFVPAQGDTHADTCEVILTHNSHDIDFMVQHGIDRSNRQALGTGSFKDDTNIEDLGKKIK